MQLVPFAAAADERDGLALSSGRIFWDTIAPNVSFFRDSSRSLPIETVIGRDFTPIEGGTVDFGYIKDVVWLKFTVANPTDQDGFILAFRENFLQLYQSWAVYDDGRVVLLDSQNSQSLFRERALQYPELSTRFIVPPGETADIYVRYWSGGSSELSWQVFGAASFADWSANRTAKNFIYYGMTILLILAACMAYLLTRQPVFGAYALYALSGLLFIMHADGNTFHYLWPNLPLFNAFATVPLGTFIICAGANFARTYLEMTKYHPIMNKIMLTVIAVALMVFFSTVIIDSQPVKRLLVLLSLVTTALLALSGFIAARTRFREVRFYVIAWSGALLSSLLMTMRHWLGLEISEDLQFDSIRVVLVLDAALMGLAILDRFNQLKQSRQEALEDSLSQARKAMQMNSRLQDIEEKVKIAEQVSASQQRNMTQAAHDLRQPLTALRLNLRSVTDEQEDASRMADIEETLEYLETLVAQQLTNALAEDAEEDEIEPTPVGDVIDSVVDMFTPDAEAKGLRLRGVSSHVEVFVPPLVLMRMLTNMVANAIKATEAGGVVVGVRHADGLRLEVHDTGPGLSRARFDRAMRMSGKREPSDNGGTGLGLQIVADLAKTHGLRIDLVEGKSHGTVLRIWLPQDQMG